MIAADDVPRGIEVIQISPGGFTFVLLPDPDLPDDTLYFWQNGKIAGCITNLPRGSEQ